MFFAQVAHNEYYRHDNLEPHTNFMPLSKELDCKECKNTIRNLNATDSAELNQYFYNGSFIYFDRLIFQVQIEYSTL